MVCDRIFLLGVFLSMLLSACSTVVVEPEAGVGPASTVTAAPPGQGAAYPWQMTATAWSVEGADYPPPQPTVDAPPPAQGPPTFPPTETPPPDPTLVPTPQVTPIPTAVPPVITPPAEDSQPFTILYPQGNAIWAYDSSTNEKWELAAIPPDIPLYLNPDALLDRQWGSAAPNGDRLAVVLSSIATVPIPGKDEPEYALYLFDIEQQSWHKLADARGEPAWSPDGTKIAFRGATSGLWVADVVTGEVGEVYAVSGEGGHAVADISWAPDSRRIVFLDRVLRSSYQIMVVDLASPDSAEILVPDDLYWAYDPSWSPGSDQIFYISFAGTHTGPEHSNNLWLIHPDGGGAIQLSENLDVVGGQPAWSPDGRWIVVAGYRQYEEAEVTTDLWLVSSDDEVLKRLTHTSDINELKPIWSPDRTHLMFFREGRGSDGSDRTLWLLDLIEGTEVQLRISARDIIVLTEQQ